MAVSLLFRGGETEGKKVYVTVRETDAEVTARNLIFRGEGSYSLPLVSLLGVKKGPLLPVELPEQRLVERRSMGYVEKAEPPHLFDKLLETHIE